MECDVNMERCRVRRLWVFLFAVAASLLVGAGVIWLEGQGIVDVSEAD
jgi:hypothetical protein